MNTLHHQAKFAAIIFAPKALPSVWMVRIKPAGLMNLKVELKELEKEAVNTT